MKFEKLRMNVERKQNDFITLHSWRVVWGLRLVLKIVFIKKTHKNDVSADNDKMINLIILSAFVNDYGVPLVLKL